MDHGKVREGSRQEYRQEYKEWKEWKEWTECQQEWNISVHESIKKIKEL